MWCASSSKRFSSSSDFLNGLISFFVCVSSVRDKNQQAHFFELLCRKKCCLRGKEEKKRERERVRASELEEEEEGRG